MDINKGWRLTLVFVILLQSCTTDGIPEGGILNHHTNGCSKKIESILVPIRCPVFEQPILSTDQRLDSLDRFKKFLESPRSEIAIKMSKQRKQDNTEEYFSTGVYHDYSNSIIMMADDKFIVNLYFRNYSLFPEKYSNREVFQSDLSEEFNNKWKDRIFRRYIGENYERFQPKLGIVHNERVGIRLLINGFSELEAIIYRDPIFKVRHIGDPVIALEEILVN